MLQLKLIYWLLVIQFSDDAYYYTKPIEVQLLALLCTLAPNLHRFNGLA